MSTEGPPEPDDTQPYSRAPQDGQQWPTYEQRPPAAEPESPSGQVPPSAPPPPPYSQPGYAQPGYAQPGYAQQPYGAPQYPGYGQPGPGYGYPFAQAHSRATTSMVLGLVAVAALLTGPFVCCVTLPGVFAAPFAIWTGLSARREIDLNPAAYSNRGQAVAGFVIGIVVSVLAVVLLLAGVVLFAGAGSGMFDTGY